MSSRLDKEKTKKTIALILDKIKTDADPILLGEYRALFKREVSLLRRSWAAAYLLMLFERGAPARAGRDRHREQAGREAGNGGNDGEESQRYPLLEAESKRLFISAGRNRRVYPREILGIINSKTAISREDIGAIRILDNYSFVQVRDTVAEQIIEALNGMMFRGRTLVVNYAKLKKDEAHGAAETGPESPAPGEPRAGFDAAQPPAEPSEQGQDHPDKEDI